MAGQSPVCPYCGAVSELTSSARVYRGRDYGPIYLCVPCWAYVGCHPGSTRPLGRLANEELRTWKRRAHAASDPIWQGGRMKRQAAYAWLSQQLGIPKDDTHIGMFDVDMCMRVVAICKPREEEKAR